MGDHERLELILAQARIAKAAMAQQLSTQRTPTPPNASTTKVLDQAALAIEAIVLLADSDFNRKSNVA